ncbi:hypothetical protein OG568_04705 [Streptomyces sp. NBC_01450]|nr:hypothetical protein [Streptomyces sp. NBC_01450]
MRWFLEEPWRRTVRRAGWARVRTLRQQIALRYRPGLLADRGLPKFTFH